MARLDRCCEEALPSVNLLSLPYDVRHLIYQHLFPAGEQIYIQAFSSSLQSRLPSETNPIPTAFLRTCRSLHVEASQHLYSTYLFNIVGVKRDCLSQYGRFEKVLRKYARDEVHVDAFSNGAHSRTMCVSLRSGEGRRRFLERRERGEKRKIEDMKKEVTGEWTRISGASLQRHLVDFVASNSWALFGAMLAFMASLWMAVAI